MGAIRRAGAAVALFALGELSARAACPPVASVEATGQATILAADASAARDHAIIDAQAKAVSQACGVSVDARSVLERAALIEHSVVNKTSGFVRSYEILEERRAEGLYFVTVRALVTGDLGDERAREFYRRFGVVAHLSATLDGAPLGGDAAGARLRSLLRDNGYQIVESPQLAAVPGYAGLAESALDGSTASARSLAGRFLAGLLVLGRVRAAASGVDGGDSYPEFGDVATHWCRASAEFKVMDAGSGKVLLAYATPVAGERGYARTQAAAAERAIDKVLAGFESKLMPGLAEYTRNAGRTITISVEGLSSKDDYDRVKAMIAGSRWASLTSAAEFRPGGASKFTVAYPEQSYILASSLERAPGISVKKFGWNDIALRWKGR